MYRWLIFLHVASLLGFLVAHGVSISVAFALTRERNAERMRALLELSANSYRGMYLALLTLLLTGVVAGFIGRWWRAGWMWLSLLLLIAITILMSRWGGNIYGQARKVAGLPYFERGKPQPALAPGSPEEVEAALARANPRLLAVIGYGGILVILWLMMFKPF